MTAIYKIESIMFPERQYFGSAVNYNSRKSHHISELKYNNHHSPILQHHVNKYGIEDLKFSTVLTGCTKEELTFIEDIFIHPKPYFNVCKTAGSSLGRKTSQETKDIQSKLKIGCIPWNKGLKVGAPWNKGKKATPEACLNQSKAQKEKYENGYINPMTGKNHTEESKEKNRIAHLNSSQETRDKQSKSAIALYKNGYINPHKGKKLNKTTHKYE